MAFSVTPTSGAGPYELSATFTGKELIDNGSYLFEVRSNSLVGSCPMNALSGINQPTLAQSLLDVGTGSITGAVAAGSCRAYTAVIRDSSTNSIVSQENVFINNV